MDGVTLAARTGIPEARPPYSIAVAQPQRALPRNCQQLTGNLQPVTGLLGSEACARGQRRVPQASDPNHLEGSIQCKRVHRGANVFLTP